MYPNGTLCQIVYKHPPPREGDFDGVVDPSLSWDRVYGQTVSCCSIQHKLCEIVHTYDLQDKVPSYAVFVFDIAKFVRIHGNCLMPVPG